ncbi:MAG: PilZ domain-containing protein [Deltaproteobacteria bacterium]|uniref:PilZ domain-containing protein n=1 Tax=Candidatus Zymogenus saltonus TaxID=2844893 RepID=A0A9D8PQ63_9DELT|nr:PilZ domain-containing protein [Candidatus Zymogenus saltonus]
MIGNSVDGGSANESRKHPREKVKIRVNYKTVDRFKEEYTENISHGGIFIKSTRPLPMHLKVKVSLSIPKWEEPVTMMSEVVRRVTEEDARKSGLNPGFALQFLDFDEKKKELDEFIKSISGVVAADERTVIQLGEPPEDFSDEGEDSETDIDEASREITMQRVRKMSMNEKMMLAPKGDKLERAALLKDLNPSVARLIIRNPRITDQEINRIAKDVGTPADVLDAIGKNRKWIQNLEIKNSIVRNPRTPSQLALRQLALLSTKEISLIAKSQHVRDNIKREAVKILTQRRERGG